MAQCTTPENHTKKWQCLILILYRQPRSDVNTTSRSHPADFGRREHAVSLSLCGFGGCRSQGEHPVGLQAGNQLPAPPASTAQPWGRGPSMWLHNGKASWKGCLLNPLATSGRVTTEALRGLCLICSPPSNQGQVWDFSQVLK